MCHFQENIAVSVDEFDSIRPTRAEIKTNCLIFLNQQCAPRSRCTARIGRILQNCRMECLLQKIGVSSSQQTQNSRKPGGTRRLPADRFRSQPADLNHVFCAGKGLRRIGQIAQERSSPECQIIRFEVPAVKIPHIIGSVSRPENPPPFLRLPAIFLRDREREEVRALITERQRNAGDEIKPLQISGAENAKIIAIQPEHHDVCPTLLMPEHLRITVVYANPLRQFSRKLLQRFSPICAVSEANGEAVLLCRRVRKEQRILRQSSARPLVDQSTPGEHHAILIRI